MGSGEIIKVDIEQQKALLSKVDRLLDSARTGHENLSRTYVEIGLALEEVDESKAWMVVARSYDSYIKDHCEPKFGKSRTQLYGYRSIAKNLLPSASESELIEMGVTKAQALAGFVKRQKKPPTDKLLADAKNPKIGIEEFRASVAESQHEKPEKGSWYDLGGFFVTPDEKEEIERGFQRATEIEPLPEDCPEWLRKKIIVQRLVAEFLSTYGCTENG